MNNKKKGFFVIEYLILFCVVGIGIFALMQKLLLPIYYQHEGTAVVLTEYYQDTSKKTIEIDKKYGVCKDKIQKKVKEIVGEDITVNIKS